MAVYSISTGELEVRWSSSDYEATTGFEVQWKSGSEVFGSSREASVDPTTSVVVGSSTTSTKRYKHTITGLTDGTEYTVRVIATNTHGDSDPSSTATGTPQSTPGQVGAFIENEVVKSHEGSYPWLRSTWDYIIDQSVDVDLHPNAGNGVAIWCSPHRPMESNLRKCYATWVYIGRGSSYLIPTITHELGHVFTLANSVTDRPGPLAVAHLYFYRLDLRGTFCAAEELYADALMILVHGERTRINSTYWSKCPGTTDSVTEEALAVVGSAVEGAMPSWFADTYHDSDGEPDLERLWADVKAVPTSSRRAVMVFQLRGEFGGYCDNAKATDSAFGTGVTRNPWQDGGCVPEEPGGLTVTPIGSGKLTVSWKAPVDDGGSPIEGYKIQWKSGSEDYGASRQAVVTDLTTLSHTISGLASGIEHTVRVLAYNHNGDGAASDTTATPSATDTTPPVLSLVTVDRATITIVYNEALDGASEPTAGAFTVNVGTTVRGVSTVEVSGSAATLTLASAVGVGETVTVDYTVPTGSDASPLRDQAENNAGGFTGRQARNHATAVMIVSDPGSDMTYIVGDAIRHQDEIDVTVTFGESVQVTGTPELTLEIGDVTKQARYLDGSGSYSLAFRYTVAEGDEDTDGLRVPAGVIGGSGTIRYVADSSEAPALVELATQSGHKVDGIRPTLVTAGADANTLRLTLTWDKALDEDSVPSPHSNAFTLSVNGDRRGITGVSVDGKVVTLILASSVMSGDDATVSYGVPFRTYDPLKDILGNYAANNSATVAIGDDTTPPTVSGDTSISYTENRTDQVASYSATDPENETVTWAALAGADAGDFAIADGVLTFRQSPDHEQPADSNRDNDYLVTVRAWDGTNYGTLDVTVTVTPVDEAATVSGETDVDFAENRTGQVGRYTATDPEGETVMLSLAGTDAGDFELSAIGVLTFGEVPDREDPADSNRDNVYLVTVRAWDGNSYGTLDVVVTVTNEDEDGTVSLSSLQPQAGTELEADLSDPDGSVTATTWVWERSTSSTGPWSTIGGATSDAYTPADADLNRFLRVTASYTDGEGSGKAAEAVSTNQVQPAPIMNTPPEFPTSETGQREVEENTPAGRDIGDPVAAVDTDVGDTLTYKLDGTDAAAFDIDELSGQLRTKTALDYENKRSYSMTLTVTDTSGADDSITLRACADS